MSSNPKDQMRSFSSVKVFLEGWENFRVEFEKSCLQHFSSVFLLSCSRAKRILKAALDSDFCFLNVKCIKAHTIKRSIPNI